METVQEPWGEDIKKINVTGNFNHLADGVKAISDRRLVYSDDQPRDAVNYHTSLLMGSCVVVWREMRQSSATGHACGSCYAGYNFCMQDTYFSSGVVMLRPNEAICLLDRAGDKWEIRCIQGRATRSLLKRGECEPYPRQFNGRLL